MVRKNKKSYLRSRLHLSRRKLTLISLIAFMFIGAGLVWAWRNDNQPSTTSAPNQAGNTNYVNLDPPTDEQKKETDAHKDELAEQSQQQQSSNQTNNSSQPSNNQKKQVTPVITSFTKDNVSAYVTGVFEDGGTCTAVFTQGNTTVSRSSTGFQNVSYTQCAPIQPNLPNTNKWSVTVSYSSSTAVGTSQSREIQ